MRQKLQVSIIHLALRESVAYNAQVQDAAATLAHRVHRLSNNNTVLRCKISVLLLAKDVVQRRNKFALADPSIHIW